MSITSVANPIMEKIESFFSESGYKELTMRTARYNTKMRRDRIYRQPYIDSQTGVAQRNCHLFLDENSRMPGALHGQVYSYPARRWKADHRSYLTTSSIMNPPKIDHNEHTITTVENPAVLYPPSNIIDDSMVGVDKESWPFYEQQEYDDIDEDEFASDEDMEDFTYSKKGLRPPKRTGMRRSVKFTTNGILQQSSRPKMRRPPPIKNPIPKMPPKIIKKVEDDPEHKPYICELCGMRYKTRPGLTYHYSHTHKDDENKDKIIIPPPSQLRLMDPPIVMGSPGMLQQAHNSHMPHMLPSQLQHRPPLQQPPHPSMSPMHPSGPSPSILPPSMMQPMQRSMPATPEPPPSEPLKLNVGESAPVEDKMSVAAEQDNSAIAIKKAVNPSPYCDFCLGDSRENKKTKTPEQLVSCADCGRSGHPTCLQFTDNMMKSVNHYRWQCIECKTCTLCGTSENDDQLLFCDDCDRGYHLYCLTPPLHEPPEGEWSCLLCIRQFHTKK